MPNHVKNRLEFKGDQKRISELIDRFTTNHPKTPHKSFDGSNTYRNELGEFGWLNVETNTFRRRDKEDVVGVVKGFNQHFNEAWDQMPDFSKIVPQPKNMNITSDGWVSDLQGKYSNVLLKDHMAKMREYLQKNPEQKKETLENFIQGVRNYIDHGHATWYTWNIANWGTKWNSYSCEKESETVYTFETAWGGVVDLIREIANQFEDLEIIYEYSDEDTGSNCGSYHFHNGKLTVTEIENGSNQAYELAIKLRPEVSEYLELVDGEYKYKDDE